jgi:hypothetical protein
MRTVHNEFSTGFPGLDAVVHGILPGDNVVWQVEAVDDYRPFVARFHADVVRRGLPLVYFRFAQHPQLIDKYDNGPEFVSLNPEAGFEPFIDEIFTVIERIGKGGCYVFDCLSELVVDWYSDRMMGNFFHLTCPYLYDYATVAYFALLRNRHSFHATDSIQEKAQVIFDIHHHRDKMYVHPLKVLGRHSETMNTIHLWAGEEFRPVTSSATISEILGGVAQPWLDFTIHRLGPWTRTFDSAAATLQESRAGNVTQAEVEALTRRLMRMAFTRDERILKLAENYIDLAELLQIRKRMIGTGLIGGKSVGMILARAVLKRSGPRWHEVLEAHDSFFIGSDVFYTFLVQNGCWWIRRKQRNLDAQVENAEEARRRMLAGVFPQYIREQFMEMLNYFGQVPIIIRSSSLLEDNFGNSFSGKYESVFCANQGTPQERLNACLNAIKTVYASTMSKEALMYRAKRGFREHEEQMAPLVQRVSGDRYGSLFFPQIAGVGYSFNPYVWNSEIDPAAGALRLVFGLGTRAVDRRDDDYTRIVALNSPGKRPESNFNEVRKHAQQKVDVLDLHKNLPLSMYFEHVVRAGFSLPLEMYASRDEEIERLSRERNGGAVFSWVLTFDTLFRDTTFVADMREMLQILHEVYAYPVDIEFTTNFLDDGSFRINLLQCRPFQVKRERDKLVNPPHPEEVGQIVLSTKGQMLGTSVSMPLDWIIYVVPERYAALSQTDRYAVARLIGKLMHSGSITPEKVMLLGPGRWGTTTPSLGVPVSFGEINTVSVLAEIALMHGGLVPEVSLGTHFFNDLVEMDMVYLGIVPGREGTRLNLEALDNAPNILGTILPGEARWEGVVRVISGLGNGRGKKIFLYINALRQEALCYEQR